MQKPRTSAYRPLPFWRSWFVPLFGLLLLVGVGTLGYMHVESLSLLDSLYITVVALTTAGSRQPQELTPTGRIFTIALVVFGVTTAAWTARAMIESFWQEESSGQRRRRRMQKMLHDLNDHFIVCGYGRIGSEICRYLRGRHMPHCVVDDNATYLANADADGELYIQGSCHNDEMLRTAGIERARGLVAATGSDAENIFVVLSARGLNPKLFVVARAAQEESVRKLERAGADRVISPYVMGGRAMAAAVVRPTVSAFIEHLTHSERGEIELMELAVPVNSKLAGKTLRDFNCHERTGAVILAKRSAEGVISPPGVLEPGDTLVVVGTAEQLERLQALI